MTRFLVTAATALVLGTSAYADGHTAAFSDTTFDEAINLNASEFIGKRVYATEPKIEAQMEIAPDGQSDWNDLRW